MKVFKLTEVQAEAILNMRLRSLRKLEEMEIQGEHDSLSKERDDLDKLIKSEARQWTQIKKQIGHIKKLFGKDTDIGKRRTKVGKAPELTSVENLEEALIEKEPITVICSSKGWIRAMKGHEHNPKDFKYKDGDRGSFIIEAQTTDKILIFGSNGRFYTLAGDKLPPGRGFGEPVRLMVDLPNDADIADMIVYNAEGKLLVAADDGRGFMVKMPDVLAQTKNGKQVLNVDEKTEAKLCYPVAPEDDHIAVIGTNRKMLVFGLAEVPEMSKGRGITLQKFKDGGLADLKTFKWDNGLSYKYGGGETVVPDLNPWLGERAQAGRVAPNGFPRNNRFG